MGKYLVHTFPRSRAFGVVRSRPHASENAELCALQSLPSHITNALDRCDLFYGSEDARKARPPVRTCQGWRYRYRFLMIRHSHGGTGSAEF